MSKNLLRLKFIGILTLMMIPVFAGAVTQKEMEQARTIAAKAYIRYANDGSGYLDDLNPTTMEELEAVLKNKEKENIKAFKAIPVPTDYKDWDKEKLVEYWAVTAFQNKGLLEKGRGGRIRARSQINKMTIAAPQPETAAQPATQSVTTASSGADTAAQKTEEMLNDLSEAQLALEAEEADEGINVEKATNYTWVYIMVLAILVAIVIALVVYATNVLKKPDTGMSSGRDEEKDSEEAEHFQSVIADKDVEISMLKRKLDNLNKQNSDLTSKVAALTAELETFRGAQRESHGTSRQASIPQGSRQALRSIFLGRANARGIFVRADRTLNPGNSVFILETTDGFSGTFKVADSPAAWGLALSNPKEYLETACTGHNLDDTAGASGIVTESSGTAVFEGGCWRVIRKAKIRYE